MRLVQLIFLQIVSRSQLLHPRRHHQHLARSALRPERVRLNRVLQHAIQLLASLAIPFLNISPYPEELKSWIAAVPPAGSPQYTQEFSQRSHHCTHSNESFLSSSSYILSSTFGAKTGLLGLCPCPAEKPNDTLALRPTSLNIIYI